MRLGVLFSGGKDSAYAAWLAMQEHEVVCLITLVSDNPASYMFHTPNIMWAGLQAEAAGLPLVTGHTKGVKEEELEDLKQVIIQAKRDYSLDGIVTGAVASSYQATRIQKICDDLDLDCLNPLWQVDQEEVVSGIIRAGFEVIVSAIAAEPLTVDWLGRRIDESFVSDLKKLDAKYGISLTGEGGEFESFVLDAPFFKKRLVVTDSERIMGGPNNGVLLVRSAELAEK